MNMTVWRITVRGLGLVQSQREPYSFLVATRSSREKDAVALAREQYSVPWWEDYILTDVVEVGRLKAAEGLNVPQEETDY